MCVLCVCVSKAYSLLDDLAVEKHMVVINNKTHTAPINTKTNTVTYMNTHINQISVGLLL